MSSGDGMRLTCRTHNSPGHHRHRRHPSPYRWWIRWSILVAKATLLSSKSAQAVTEINSETDTSGKAQSVGILPAAANETLDRQNVTVDALVLKLARALSIPVEDVDPAKPIHAAGADSVVALEVRYWFMKEVKANMAVPEIMSSSSLRDLAALVETRSEYTKASTK